MVNRMSIDLKPALVAEDRGEEGTKPQEHGKDRNQYYEQQKRA